MSSNSVTLTAREHVFPLFVKYVSANVLGMIGYSCYILADTFFVARGIGSDAIAALNLVLPAFSLLNGTGLMIGMGAAARYSLSSGRADSEIHRTIFTQALQLAFVAMLFFFSIGLFFARPLCVLLGACLRNFNEQAQIDSVNGALALRPQIEKIIDQIWEEGFDGIYFIGIGGTYASSMQVEVYMRGRSKLPVFVENAAEFLTTGNKKFTNKSVVIISSVSGNTKEMVELVDRVHEKGAKVFSFIDNPGTTLTQPDKQDYLIVYPMNEQLKFYMVANYLMYKNGEFDDYDRYNKEMEANLADVLAQVEKDSDEWAYEYAKNKVAFWKEHKDLPHYFIGSGNQYGATYSYAMCYWEEQMWIRTKSISCQEFFHGMQEIIVEDTPVTLFMGEDEQRPLAERVAKFLPRVNANYTIIDTKEHELKGISPEFRGTISHLVMHGVNNRVDAYMELFLRHPLSIRRYYRQFDY